MNASLLLLSLLASAGDAHEKANPLYAERVKVGLPVNVKDRAKLPLPRMADGMAAKDQLAVLKKLVGDEFGYGEFVGKSQFAPYRLRLTDVEPSNPKTPARAVEVAFVAHGDLKALANKPFLDRVLDNNRKGGKGKALTPADLAKRKIAAPDEKKEGFAQLIIELIDKVELTAVGHSFFSQTSESVVVAGRIDPRFLGDAQFPNVWRSILKKGARTTLGPPAPYDGAAYYVKITRIQGIPNALFVEAYIVFLEPLGWFDGANLLRSKLPLVIQSQVRAFRRELMK